MNNTVRTILAYIPVIHRGVVAWLSKHPDAEILVLGKTITEQFRPLQKDIRALSAAEIVTSLQALKLGQSARVIERVELAELSGELVMADEALSHELAETALAQCQIAFEPIWLRWEKSTITGERVVQPDLKLVRAELTRQLAQTTDTDLKWLLTAQLSATNSADWWRQVGGVVVKDGLPLLQAYNHHVPSEQQPYLVGDPRAEFGKGIQMELSSALHAEAGLIVAAAKKGISLEGTTLYVTTFPCPSCAKLVAESGITHLVYQSGYSVLDGEEILRAAGVSITQYQD